MSWKTEHGADFEIPVIVEHMVKLGILRDDSWHNDTMPRFTVADPDDAESGVALWVDHPIGSERETGPEGPRYIVNGGPFADYVDDFESSDLEKALSAVLEFAEKHIPKFERVHLGKLIKSWVLETRK